MGVRILKLKIHQIKMTLMNRNHRVCDFIYDYNTKLAQVLDIHEGCKWAPMGTRVNGREVDDVNLSQWIAHRCMPAFRPEAARLLGHVEYGSTDELMFDALGLNLSDQYWFRPAGEGLDWVSVNLFNNPYETSGKPVGHNPDYSTDGALEKTWRKEDGVSYLYKSSSAGDEREPFNEYLASALLKRLLDPSEFVEYELVRSRGRWCSKCATMINLDTEFVPAREIVSAFMITEGKDLYRGYASACESLEVEGVRTSLAKMIVADHVMANFDRHLGNFGLIRNAETLDGWRIAPLFDNGAGFFSRATLDEMRKGKFIWKSHPFEEYPLLQLARVEDMSWYDPDMLIGFTDEVGEILSINENLSAEFVEQAMHHVGRNIEAVNDIAAERIALG